MVWHETIWLTTATEKQIYLDFFGSLSKTCQEDSLSEKFADMEETKPHLWNDYLLN